MKKIDFVKDILPHLIAIIVFFIITLVFYSPEVFEGKQVSQHDVLQGAGSGQEMSQFRKDTGEEGLWTNSMFGGMPAYLVNIKWSDGILQQVQNVLSLWLPVSSSTTMLTLVCAYILLIVFGVRPYLAIAGAIAYAFSSFNIISIQAGHIWKERAIAYMPLVLAGVHLVFKSKNKLLGAALTALAIGLEIKANHLQITYYLFLLLLIYGISALVFSIKDKTLPNLTKTALWLVLAAVIGVGSNIGRLWSTYEYSKFSTRGQSELTAKANNESGLDKDYAFQWSNGITEPLTYLVPNLYGGASSQLIVNDKDSETLKALQRASDPQMAQQLARYSSGYWGEQPGTAPIYIGAIVCFLFVLGIIIMEKSTSIWLVAGTLFAIILSWGKNFEAFNYFMFDYFPGYNKFRAVTMIVCVVILCMVLLGFIALEKTFQTKLTKDFQKKIFIALGITGGLCLLFFLFSGAFFSFERSFEDQLPKWFTSALAEDRQSLLKADAFRSLIFILLSFGAIFGFLKGKISSMTTSLIIIALVTADLFTVGKRYLNKDHFEKNPQRAFFAASNADKAIKKDPATTYRVVNLLNPWSEAKTSSHHHSIGGYHGAKMKRYQQLIDYCLDGEVKGVIQNLQQGKADQNANFSVINMLNTKYYLFGSEENNVLKNPGAAGNAWFVSDIKQVNNPDEEIAETCALTDASKTAIVNTAAFKLGSSTSSGSGKITLTDYKPNHLTYEASATSGGLAVFSEIYYPTGWVAYIDGKEVPILQANFVLRALEVPEGTHKIEFKFVPKAYAVGNSITLISSILLMILLVGSIVLSLKKES